MNFKKVFILVCVMALSLSSTSLYAASDNDESYSKLAEELTSIAGLTRSLSKNNSEIQKAEELLSTFQTREQTPRLLRRVKKLESRIAALNKKKSVLEQDIASRNQEAESLKSQFSDKNINAWNAKAKAQIIEWYYNPKNKTMQLVILHRNSGKTSSLSPKLRVRDNEKFYLAEKLPENLQGVVPEGWTVDELKSGEEFLLTKQSSMKIIPAEPEPEPEESESEAETESESASQTESESETEYYEMPF